MDTGQRPPSSQRGVARTLPSQRGSRPQLPWFILGIAIGLLLVSLSGCGSGVQAMTDRLGSALDRYCALDQSTRIVVREQINAASPHSIRVVCAGDQ